MLAELFLHARCQVVALIPDEAAVEAINNLANPAYQAILHHAEVKTKYLRRNWQPLTQACQQAEHQFGKPDLVFLPYLDNLLFPTWQRLPWLKERAFELLFPYHWAGLYFHPGYQPYAASEQMLNYRRCAGIGILNPLDRERLARSMPHARLLPFPDIADFAVDTGSNSLINELQARANGRPIIASVGVQARRKGLITMLDMAQLPGAENFFFFTGGEVRDSLLEPYEINRIAALAANPPLNLWLHPHKIATEGLYNRIIQQADAVYVGYQNFPSSSNTLTKAAYFNRPILASETDYIGLATKKYSLGQTFNAYNPAAGLDALQTIRQWPTSEAGRQAFLAINSIESARAFIKTLLQTI